MRPSKKRFLKNRGLYEEAILRRVCVKCIDFGEDGRCHSHDPEGCAIFRYLPELVQIAERLDEYKIKPYAEAVRSEICMQCRGGSPEGKCPLRDTLDCGLDRYLSLVLDAIEEVKQIEAEKDWLLWRQL